MDLKQLMQQAQEMQSTLKKTQDDLANMKVRGESGAGLVKAQMTGRYEVTKIEIDPSLLTEKDILEDLVAAAVNDGVRKIGEASRNRMADLTGKMNLPPGFNFDKDTDQ